MARWDPGAEDRLRRAALDLYSEHGYDSVTVEQIAQRAGLKRRSYFRYFPDKREVLFAGSERLPVILAEAIARSDATSPMDILQGALAEAGTLLLRELEDRKDEVQLRRAIIATTPDLRAREQSKMAEVAQAIAGALLASSISAPTAALIGSLAAVVFGTTLNRCLDQGTSASFPLVLDDLMHEIARFTQTNRATE